VLSLTGVLVETGVVDLAGEADERALAWHAYFWDPWFAFWGAAFAVTMWWSRRPTSVQDDNRGVSTASESGDRIGVGEPRRPGAPRTSSTLDQ
jgi:hypothetical protein